MAIVCFGDSNTYGYDPRSFFGERYGAEHRWVDLLAQMSGRELRNAGMNGREVPRGSISVSDDTELLIVMLGTNDLLQGRSVAETANTMERFLLSLPLPCTRILLVAPPPMVRGAWVEHQNLIDSSLALATEYKRLAEKLNILFVDAGVWDIPMCFDGVHFTEEGHRRFAAGVFDYLQTVEGLQWNGEGRV